MTSTQLSKRFLAWWQKENPTGRIFRNNSGVAWGINDTGKKYPVKFGIPPSGGSDYIAFIPDELNKRLIVFFYEIKCLKDKMSKAQIQFAHMITKMNGVYYIVKERDKKPQIKDGRLSYPLSGNNEFYLEKWTIK